MLPRPCPKCNHATLPSYPECPGCESAAWAKFYSDLAEYIAWSAIHSLRLP